MKPLPPDHPIFSRGWIVGQTNSGGSPNAKPESEEGREVNEAMRKLAVAMGANPESVPENLRKVLENRSEYAGLWHLVLSAPSQKAAIEAAKKIDQTPSASPAGTTETAPT